MPSNDPRQRFADIVEHSDHIADFVSGLTYEEYVQDTRTRLAVERALQIIAEAAVKLGPVAEERVPDQPWKKIRGFGNVLRHEYDRLVDPEIWALVHGSLRSLREACARQLG